MKDKGYVQVYTGNGKGKTTAALGLTLRAAGAGLKVFIGQFVKGTHYSELDALKRLDDQISVTQYGSGSFLFGQPTEKDAELARAGFEELKQIALSGEYDIVIFEEANVAVGLGLLQVEDLLSVIEEKPENVELVFTGRGAHEKLVAAADLVTEMKEVKHYYHAGVQARTGIEK
ncbi:cob(I)yrinic acid a,c-diamide adenosyltransferase [Verrucomicrobiota bacterium]